MSGRGWQRFLWTVLLPGLAGWAGGFCIYRNRAAVPVSDKDRPPLLEPIAGSADRDGSNTAPSATDDEIKNRARRERLAALEKRLQYPSGKPLPRGNERTTAVFRVLQEWQWLDPAQAAAAVRSCGGEGYPLMMREIIETFVNTLPVRERIAFLRSLSPREQADYWTRNDRITYSDASVDAADAWIHHDPAPTASEMARALTGAAREKTLENWFTWWSEKDPASALAGAQAALPDDELRVTAGRTVMTSWAQDEPVKAAKYLKEMPEGAARDGAAEAMAAVMRKFNDSSDGTDWLGMIADPVRRQAARERLEKTIPEGKTNPAPHPAR